MDSELQPAILATPDRASGWSSSEPGSGKKLHSVAKSAHHSGSLTIPSALGRAAGRYTLPMLARASTNLARVTLSLSTWTGIIGSIVRLAASWTAAAWYATSSIPPPTTRGYEAPREPIWFSVSLNDQWPRRTSSRYILF